MLNFRRLVLFLVLLPGLLVAEQIYLKDGSVVEGTILQQSRTSIQIRTVDGVKTISKDSIRRIDYGKGTEAEQQRKEAERKIEAERIKEAERQKEAQRLREAERAKELQRQEELRREAEARADEEKRAKEQKRQLEETKESQSDLPKESGLWWIEPRISIGRGQYRSHLETVHRRYQTGLQILYPDDVYGFYAPEARWNHTGDSHRNLSLRAGWKNWVIEFESQKHQASADFFQYQTAQPYIAGSDTVFDYLYYARVDGIKESNSMLRFGYRFFHRENFGLTGLLGARSLSADAAYYYLGQSRSLFPDGSEQSDSIHPVSSTIGLYGNGPEATLELSWTSNRLTLVGRASIYAQDIRSQIVEMYIMSDGTGDNFSASGEKYRFRVRGYDYSLRASYRTVWNVELFVVCHVSRTRWELRRVRESYSLFYNGTFNEWFSLPAEKSLGAKNLSPALDRHSSGGQVQLIEAGVSRLFWF